MTVAICAALCIISGTWALFALGVMDRTKRIRASWRRRELAAIAAEKRALQGLRTTVAALDEKRRIEQSALEALEKTQKLLRPRALTREEIDAFTAPIDLPGWMQFKN